MKYGFDQFEEPKNGAIFFSSKKDVALDYAHRGGSPWMSQNENPQAYESYVRMEKPLVIDAQGTRNDNIPVPWAEWKPKVFGNLPKDAVSVEDAARYAKENGYDGLIVKNVIDAADGRDRTKSDVYAVFKPEQIKSTTNSGVFDRNSANLYDTTPKLTEQVAPTWYLKSRNLVDEAKQSVFTAAQARGLFKEVKADEMKWTGLDDFLKAKEAKGEKVTKEELQKHLEENNVDVQEVMKGGEEDANAFNVYKMKKRDLYERIDAIKNSLDQEKRNYEAAYKNNPGDTLTLSKIENKQKELFAERANLIHDLSAIDESYSQSKNKAKFAKQQLPGGENYRELLLTLPKSDESVSKLSFEYGNARTQEERDAIRKKIDSAPEEFYSSHFDEPNIPLS